MLSRMLCEKRLWFSMFHAKLNDPGTDQGLSCIAMVTRQEGETGHDSVSLANKFAEEMLLSEDQKKAFTATQSEWSGRPQDPYRRRDSTVLQRAMLRERRLLTAAPF